MGGAFVRGLISAGKSPSDFVVADPVLTHLGDLEELGVVLTTNNREAIKAADFVMVAVKPWLVKEIAVEIKDFLKSGTEVCFIEAGIKAHEIYDMFASVVPENISIAIPNTAMSKRESMTFIVSVNGAPIKATTLFSDLGEVMEIEERLLPGATALASCGLAYAMRYVRAACEGGVELGFKASQAQEIIAQTLKGAVALLKEPGAHPESEIDKVTTPGGITIKGLNTMEKFGFSTAVIEGLKASCLK